jgi:hypothetical protein
MKLDEEWKQFYENRKNAKQEQKQSSVLPGTLATKLR